MKGRTMVQEASGAHLPSYVLNEHQQRAGIRVGGRRGGVGEAGYGTDLLIAQHR